MKILIVGGGPGGLYAGLLLKKNQPHFQIEIIERNPADATYGWGVVFSDRTLNNFREADFPTYEAITNSFVIWPAIDTYYRDRCIRCGGHSFAGLYRPQLLSILQARCQELGISLQFETELTDFSRFEAYDLVIAADGVNSLIRETYARAFQPSLELGQARFIWFGTDRVLDSFTFIFRENEHGLFQVHAYPFDGTRSTFIVECDEAVWRRAGLDQADEAMSVDYCQRLFADFLRGRRLLSNKSSWINFLTVRCKTWRHRNIVLLGDSAHTAHFSIGSGTRLAMEDSIALANAFATAPDQATALNMYEMERRPRVELLQQAAAESQSYFENIKRYLHLDPLQFTSNLLTRSGRVTYDNLRVRDPFYLDEVDRQFGAADSASAPLLAPPPLFAPLDLDGLNLVNRVVLSPDLPGAATEGRLSPRQIDALVTQAVRGPGLLRLPTVAVTAAGRITPADSGLYDEAQADLWRQVVQRVHEASAARVMLQLNHAGRRGATRPRAAGLDRALRRGAWPLLAPSALPYTRHSVTPAAMNEADMAAVLEAFATAARLAAAIGVDMLQIHAGHGYLLGSFLSPLSNQRQDSYGGALENRLRFPLQVWEAVRAAWPAERPLALTINADDWANGGLTPEDAQPLAEAFQQRGCALFEFVAGGTVPPTQPDYRPGFLVQYSDRLRHEVGTHTLVGGRLLTSGEINAILAAGRGDLCIMSEP